MKKLLCLLSVLTISGSTVPTTIAASSYQKEEIIRKVINSEINFSQIQNENLPVLKRFKRGNHNRNSIEMQSNWTHYDFFLHISRENWEKTKLYYKTSNNNYQKFKWQFYNMINYFWKDSRMWDSGIWTITKTTFDKFEYINQIYNSLKNGNGLRIKIVQDGKLWNVSSQCEECSANSYEKYRNFNYYNEKIKLLGIGDGYRGEIGLDTLNNKIWFLGNEKLFHEYFVNKNYNTIIIKNQIGKEIREIIIYGNESIQKIIKDYNLENGIDYQNGYIIEVWSAEPKRTLFVMDEHNNYMYYTDSNPTFRKFIILNNKLLTFSFYKNKYFSLLLNWQTNFNEWRNELNRQIKEDVQSFTIEHRRTWKGNKINELKDKIFSLKQTLQIIENEDNINKLTFRIQELENDFNDLKNRVNLLYNHINSNSGSSLNCTNIATIGAGISNFIPGIGQVLSAVSTIIAGICAIDNINI